MFGERKFKSKCKSLIRLTMTRLEAARKKRGAVQRYLKNDVADLLRTGLDSNAFVKTEALIVEINIMSCYDFIEQFCGCISNHVSDMCKQSQCPEECKEAVPSLMFAAARFADLPELRELRDMFTEKYGKSLDCFVNQQFEDKLKQKHATKDEKIQVVRDVAQEFCMEWDSKALERKLSTAPTQKIGKDGDEEDFPLRDKIEGGNNKQKENGYKPQSRGRENKSHPSNGEDQDYSQASQSKMSPSPQVQHEKTTISCGPVEGKVGCSKQEEDAMGSNPKPRSVRRRPIKPGPNGTRPRPEGERQGLQNSRFTDIDGDQDEKIIDDLLDHFSKKPNFVPPKASGFLKPSHPQLQAVAADAREPHQAVGENLTRPKLNPYGPPSKTTSLPVEAPATASEAPKGHVRAISMQADMHVHPKLPDFEGLAARVAALGGM